MLTDAPPRPIMLAQSVPYSQEAEEAVIGSVLINPAAFLVVRGFVSPEDFYVLRHSYIWEAFDRLSKRGDPIDYLMTFEELRVSGRLNEIGGPAYLTQLVNATPTSVHAEIYARLVQKAAIRRRLLLAADEIRGLALDEEKETDIVEAEAFSCLMHTQRSSTRDFTSMQQAMMAHAARTQEAFENPREILGIPSALTAVNRLLKGYRGSKLYICAGRPGMGKSSYLFTEAAHMAKSGLPVAFFSLEMGLEEVVDCFAAAQMSIDATKLASGKMTQAEWAKYLKVSADVMRWPLFIDDTSDLTPSQLRLRCLRLYHETGLAAVFVDYLQLMNGGLEVRYNTRTEEIGYVSRSMKKLSKELDIPVICAAQLSRAVEQRPDKRPMLSDLRESGNIENDADVVMFFYREDYYAKTNPPPVVSKTEIGIAKHRGGPTGTLETGFYGALKKMVGYEAEDQRA